jgi:hypothetical protein
VERTSTTVAIKQIEAAEEAGIRQIWMNQAYLDTLTLLLRICEFWFFFASSLVTIQSIFVTKCLGVNDNATIVDYTHFHMYMYLNWFFHVGISYDANNVNIIKTGFSSTQIHTCIYCNKRFTSMRSVSMHLKGTANRHAVNFLNRGKYDRI